jgi:hypothetical protein
MDRPWQVLLVLAGLITAGCGMREVRTLSRMRRFGFHSTGIVLRHEITGHRDTSTMYAPVVGFCDEYGARREFRSRVSSTSRRPPVGSPVGVVHLPGRPETARMDTAGYRIAVLALAFGAGTAFLVVAVVFAAG